MSVFFSLMVGRAFAALRAIGGAIGKYPVPAAFIALSCACALLLWQKDRAVRERDAARSELKRTIAAYETAQTLARNDAIRERAAVEQQYKDHADATDHDYQQQLTAARSAADRYVRDHPVALCSVPSAAADSSVARETVAPPDDHPARVSPAVPPGAVVVSAADVRACTDAVDYAIAAHNWALSVAAPTGP